MSLIECIPLFLYLIPVPLSLSPQLFLAAFQSLLQSPTPGHHLLELVGAVMLRGLYLRVLLVQYLSDTSCHYATYDMCRVFYALVPRAPGTCFTYIKCYVMYLCHFCHVSYTTSAMCPWHLFHFCHVSYTTSAMCPTPLMPCVLYYLCHVSYTTMPCVLYHLYHVSYTLMPCVLATMACVLYHLYHVSYTTMPCVLATMAYVLYHLCHVSLPLPHILH